VQIRLGPLHVARAAERAHGIALLDRRVSPDGERTEVDESDGVPVGGADRDRQPATRHRSHEGDGPLTRREHGLSGLAPDIDSAVLANGVRIVAEPEGPQHRPRGRPAPGPRSGSEHEGREEQKSGCLQSRQHCVQVRWTHPLLSNQITD